MTTDQHTFYFHVSMPEIAHNEGTKQIVVPCRGFSIYDCMDKLEALYRSAIRSGKAIIRGEASREEFDSFRSSLYVKEIADQVEVIDDSHQWYKRKSPELVEKVIEEYRKMKEQAAGKRLVKPYEKLGLMFGMSASQIDATLRKAGGLKRLGEKG